MLTLSIQPKHVFTQRNLRVNWWNRLEIWGMLTLLIQVSRKFPSRVDVGKDQRVDVVRLANYANELSGKWLKILRESSHQKLVWEKSNFCKIQGMSTLSIHAPCCMQWDKVSGLNYIDSLDESESRCGCPARAKFIYFQVWQSDRSANRTPPSTPGVCSELETSI